MGNAFKTGQSLDLKNARVLIAGAASLVGSHTADALLAAGARDVVLLDNFSFGSIEAIKHLQDHPRVKIVRADLLRLPEIIAATKGVDGVVHLAAYMSLGFSQTPWQAIDVNLRGLQNMLEACAINGVKKLIFASSNATYGYGTGIKGDLRENLPFHSEGAPPAAILYGASKIMGEQLCRTYWQQRGLDYLVLRYSTVYGERQHYRAANALYIMQAYDQITAGQAPVMPGDGSETKHFVYVTDVARANLVALQSATTDTAMNISGPDAVTTGELVQFILDYCHSDLKPEIKPDPPGTVRLTSGGVFFVGWAVDHQQPNRCLGSDLKLVHDIGRKKARVTGCHVKRLIADFHMGGAFQ
jgi:UDP-glucose 4-epimerase